MSSKSETERKRKGDPDAGGGGGNGGVNGGGRSSVTVEDREVDEFFAILRRMHTAVSNLKKGEGVNGVSHALTVGVRSDRSEDNGDGDGDGDGVSVNPMVRAREVVAESVGLDFDLNADPVPESDPV